MKKLIYVFVILLIFVGVGCKKTDITGNAIQLTEIGKPMEVYFCPREDCEKPLIELIDAAKYSVHCAFFEINLEKLISTLNKKSKTIDVRLEMDSDNYHNQTKGIPTVLDDTNQLSHNKFCVIDGKFVISGSFNPTKTGNEKNNNNLIIIYSKFLAENYEDEFSELWARQFGNGNKVRNPKILFNNNEIENYFCPEDKCSQHVIKEILKAKNSVYFMEFAFTDEKVADAILMSDASDIKGVFDNMQAGQKYSQFKRLKEFGVDVIRDTGKGLMHHKVMIIDNSTVITGSYNPTSAADNKNDENILIIRDRGVAQMYLEEIEALFIS